MDITGSHDRTSGTGRSVPKRAESAATCTPMRAPQPAPPNSAGSRSSFARTGMSITSDLGDLARRRSRSPWCFLSCRGAATRGGARPSVAPFPAAVTGENRKSSDSPRVLRRRSLPAPVAARGPCHPSLVVPNSFPVTLEDPVPADAATDPRRYLVLAKRHYENFPVGSWLLPARARAHLHRIYAFARVADNLADEWRDAEALSAYRRDFVARAGGSA